MKYLVVTILVAVNTLAYSQTVELHLRDQMGKNVGKVFVYNKTRKIFCWSDSLGRADIVSVASDTIIIRHLSYMKEIFIVPNNFGDQVYVCNLRIRTYPIKEVIYNPKQIIIAALRRERVLSVDEKHLNSNTRTINKISVDVAIRTPVKETPTNVKDFPMLKISALPDLLFKKK